MFRNDGDKLRQEAFCLLFTHAAYLHTFINASWFYPGKEFKGLVIEYDKRGDSLLVGNPAAVFP